MILIYQETAWQYAYVIQIYQHSRCPAESVTRFHAILSFFSTSRTLSGLSSKLTKRISNWSFGYFIATLSRYRSSVWHISHQGAVNVSNKYFCGKSPNLLYSHKYSLRRNLGLPHPKPYVSHGRYIAPAPSPDKVFQPWFSSSITPTTHQFYEYRDLRKRLNQDNGCLFISRFFHVPDLPRSIAY